MKVYVNRKQRRFLQAKQRRKTFVAGRGSGKTKTLGFTKYQCFNYMPKGVGLIAGLTYGQILNNVIPECIDAWNSCGLKEYDSETGIGHYVIGKKPPRHFELPYRQPRKYTNVISFINGYATVLGSLDIADTLRGGSYDDLQVDESALVKQDDFNKILVPMVRGNLYRNFAKYPVHHSICDFTSMPWLQSGFWVFETEELAKENPDEYFYLEAKSIDNIDVLGAKWFEQQKKILSPLEYAVEIDNKRLKKLPNTFYPSFNENIHTDFNTYGYNYTESGILVQGHKDYSPSKYIDVSFDFNANFNSMIVAQDNGSEYRIIDELYLSDYQTIDKLVEAFCLKYPNHHTKYKSINIYGDRNGNNRQANSELTFYEQIILGFTKYGWSCTNHVTGLDPDHKTKHFFINNILAGKETHLPKIIINANNCKYLIISIQNSPITGEFKKDKSSEKQNIDQRYATHLSDCFDNLIFRKFGGQVYEVQEISIF